MAQDFPQNFIDQIGQEVKYSRGGKFVCEGKVIDLRWSNSFIKNMRSGKEYYGIQLKIKPTDGHNANRAIWTMAFNSKVLRPREGVCGEIDLSKLEHYDSSGKKITTN